MVSAMFKFLVDIITSFAKRLEDTMWFEFKDSQLIGGQEILIETFAGDSFKCSKDHQNLCNLKIIFSARGVEPVSFKWRPLRPKCLLVMFLLRSISMFKSNKCSHKFLAVGAAWPLSELVVSVENATSVLGKISLKRVFSLRSLSNGWHHWSLCGQWCDTVFCQGPNIHHNWDHLKLLRGISLFERYVV